MAQQRQTLKHSAKRKKIDKESPITVCEIPLLPGSTPSKIHRQKCRMEAAGGWMEVGMGNLLFIGYRASGWDDTVVLRQMAAQYGLHS
jgi:hypothetical protein